MTLYIYRSCNAASYQHVTTANMESTSHQKSFTIENIKYFPYENGKINLVKFLEATSDLIKLVDHLGHVFAPVKYDMEGNVQKIIKFYHYDKDSCLLELMHNEYVKGETSALEGILWLNRALLFFELAFQEIDASLKSSNNNVAIKRIFTVAYEGSVKKYHSWITQQIFNVICKVSPTLPQIIKSLNAENDLENFQLQLSNFNATLHNVRCQIDSFFVNHNLFRDS